MRTCDKMVCCSVTARRRGSAAAAEWYGYDMNSSSCVVRQRAVAPAVYLDILDIFS
jgi:hypothetical protein